MDGYRVVPLSRIANVGAARGRVRAARKPWRFQLGHTRPDVKWWTTCTSSPQAPRMSSASASSAVHEATVLTAKARTVPGR